MQDGTQKNIDLDALVDTLLRERQGDAAGQSLSPPAEIQAEDKPTSEPDKVPIPEPETPSAPTMEPQSACPASVPSSVEDGTDVARPQPTDSRKKASLKGLFRRKNKAQPETEVEDEGWSDWDLKPIGHYRVGDEPAPASDVELIVEEVPAKESPSAASMDEFPPVQAVAETITMPVVLPSGMPVSREDATRVIPVKNSQPAPEPESEPEPLPDDQLPDQLSLEEMVRVEDIDPEAPEPEEEPEELLQRARQERIRDFTFNGEEEEANEPEEEVEPEEDESEIEDYTSYEDTKAVQLELQYRSRTALFTMLATVALELVLLVLTLLAAGDAPITGMGYLTVQLFALGLMMAINYRAVSRGLSGLFTLRANADTPAALASTVALFDVVLHFIDSKIALPFWAPVAGLLLLMCAGGHYAQAACVRRNFAFVSYPGRKYAAALIEDENAQQEIGRRAVGSGEATVAYFRPTAFLSDYLTNAYEDDRSDDWCRWAVPVGLGLSVVLSGVFVLTGSVEGFWGWLQLFTGLLCVSMQLGRLAVQLSMNQSSRYVLSRGGFMVGWRAVRGFGNPDGLVVDIADLYPDESMLLHGIKTFSGAHIDDAILDAASLSVRSGGPLAMIFRRIIQNKEELLHEVDSLVYEQGMGLSGWVDGRRVLVGNRRLLQNHGVDVPSADYEARYAKDGRRLAYLSTAGELSAMFVVSYLPDPDIQAALHELCRAKVTLLVRSCDPNITTDDLCADFELDPYYVDVLPAAAGRQYMQLVQEESPQTTAVMASNGHILGTARLLSACRHLQTKSLLALLVQALSSALGLLLCVVWMLNNTLSLFQPLALVLVTALLAWLIPLFRRV